MQSSKIYFIHLRTERSINSTTYWVLKEIFLSTDRNSCLQRHRGTHNEQFLWSPSLRHQCQTRERNCQVHVRGVKWRAKICCRQEISKYDSSRWVYRGSFLLTMGRFTPVLIWIECEPFSTTSIIGPRLSIK